jgi:hypothetical protein
MTMFHVVDVVDESGIISVQSKVDYSVQQKWS